MSVAIRRCEDAADKQRSLEIYNDAVPRRAVTPELVASWEQASLDSAEFLAALEDNDVGSAVAAIGATQPDACFALITVLPAHRRRGAGTALYETVSAWA